MLLRVESTVKFLMTCGPQNHGPAGSVRIGTVVSITTLSEG